jgi:hypothetical protein
VYTRVMTSGLEGVPVPPLLASATVIVGIPQLSDAVAWEGEPGGT